MSYIRLSKSIRSGVNVLPFFFFLFFPCSRKWSGLGTSEVTEVNVMLQELVWKENVPPKIVTMSVCASTVYSLNKPTDKIYNYNLYITGFCWHRQTATNYRRITLYSHTRARARERLGRGQTSKQYGNRNFRKFWFKFAPVDVLQARNSCFSWNDDRLPVSVKNFIEIGSFRDFQFVVM